MFETDWIIPFLTIGWAVAASAMATLVELGVDSSRLRKIHDAQVALVRCVHAS
jgi:hypothetical protein